MRILTTGAYRGPVFGALGMTSGIAGLLGTAFAGSVSDHFGDVSVQTAQGTGYILAGFVILSLLTTATRESATTPSTVASP